LTKSWRWLVAVVAALSIVAAACGDDDDDSSSGDTATTAASGDTATTAGSATTGGTATEGAATLEEVCNENKGVTLPAGFKVGLVTDLGKVDDGTFNQYAYEGMKAAADCFGFETTYIETASEADYAKNIATVLGSNPTVVVTVGFLIANDTLAAAQANPNVKFIGIDQFQATYPANYIGVLFREDQGGFLAGAMAALLTKSNVIGVVGGREDVPPVVRFVNAYETGAHYIKADVRVLSTYNESFTDPAKGASDAQQFIGEGADVIFGAGGPTGSGGVTAATAAGKWGIGVDQDEYFTTFAEGATAGAEFLATSALKRVDLGVFLNILAAIDGSFAGSAFTLTAENGGITYAPFHDAAIPDDVATKIEEVRAGLADGSIDTGVDPITGLPK
jgi:basic membrane protein A and related proteins